MKKLKEAVKKATGHETKYIFSYKLSQGGFIDYGTGDKTYSINFKELEIFEEIKGGNM